MSRPIELLERTESISDQQLKEIIGDPEFWEEAAHDFAETGQSTESDRLDLQRAKRLDLEERRAQLMEILMQRPAEAFIEEVTFLAAHCYQERMRTSRDQSTFFTRQNNTHQLDSLTTISDSDDGNMTIFRHRMFAPGTYGFDNPVEIIATTSGDFFVRTSTYKNGLSSLKDVTGTPEATAIMREYFTSSLRAAGAVEGRGEAENAQADQDAIERYHRLQSSEYKYLL